MGDATQFQPPPCKRCLGKVVLKGIKAETLILKISEITATDASPCNGNTQRPSRRTEVETTENRFLVSPTKLTLSQKQQSRDSTPEGLSLATHLSNPRGFFVTSPG